MHRVECDPVMPISGLFAERDDAHVRRERGVLLQARDACTLVDRAQRSLLLGEECAELRGLDARRSLVELPLQHLHEWLELSGNLRGTLLHHAGEGLPGCLIVFILVRKRGFGHAWDGLRTVQAELRSTGESVVKLGAGPSARSRRSRGDCPRKGPRSGWLPEPRRA
ncbi:hypothetical protein GY45DRAFT_385486 [Cubamyces sp. BRFM 1775]|nr:hypothetical protein GY45DRAFT_385486 [Cubamyces sp. BRFM 1775]